MKSRTSVAKRVCAYNSVCVCVLVCGCVCLCLCVFEMSVLGLRMYHAIIYAKICQIKQKTDGPTNQRTEIQERGISGINLLFRYHEKMIFKKLER